jgi:YOP proteins translocation protein K (YscK)
VNWPQRMLSWPQNVAKQVHAAMFLPARDMHPDQRARCVPPALEGLSSSSLSKALIGQDVHDWDGLFDGRQRGHRMALLPRVVIERLCWNLGLLTHATVLRQVVLRQDLALLSDQGMDDASWALVFRAPENTGEPSDLGRSQMVQWHEVLRETGERGLAAFSQTLPAPFRQRLLWKLPHLETSSAVPAPALLELAYEEAVLSWSTEWDACLSAASPVH